MTGQLVVFEGKDGTGKSTLAKLLFQAAQDRGRKAMLVGFPTHTGHIGAFIRASFEGKVTFDRRAYLYLMIADGIDWEDRINAFVSDGGLFIADRHTTFSAFVYQTEDYSFDAVSQVYSAHPWRKPDMAFLVDAPTAVSMERQRSRTKYADVVWENEDVSYNERLRQKYLKLFEAYEGPSKILDGTKTPEELLDEVMKILGV